MDTKSKGRELHAEAVMSRETKDFAASLDQNNRALEEYDKSNDPSGFAEAMAQMSGTYGLIGERRKSNRMLRLSRAIAAEAVSGAREGATPDALALPLYALAKADAHLGSYVAAIQSCSEAIRIMHNTPPERHNRPAVVAEMEARLATYEYQAGDKEAVSRAEEAIHRIKEADESSKYTKDVWISGSYMHLAEAVENDDKEKAKHYLEKARAIVDANPELLIRKDELDALSSRIM